MVNANRRHQNARMREVSVHRLKTRLREFLRAVRSGRSITVLDRGVPIARVVPYVRDASDLVVRRARGERAFGRVPLPPPFKTDVDVVKILLEERNVDR